MSMRTPQLDNDPPLPAIDYPGWVTDLGTVAEGTPPVAFYGGQNHCGECDADPCECSQCSECPSEANCPFCYKLCSSCCDCDTCFSCGSSIGGWSDGCENCEQCENCCDCDICAKCESTTATKCENGCGSCIGCCMGCADMTKDVGWAVEVSYTDPMIDRFEEIDPPQRMADFYLLSFMDTNPPVAPYAADLNDALIAISSEAKAMRQRVVDELDGPFQEYLDIAVGGELRHHPAIFKKVLDPSRSRAWGEWRNVREKVGLQALKDAVMLFNEFDDDGGFGGAPWATAAQVLHDRIAGTIPPWLFVDRVFTLQHHNGCILNKVAWANNGRILGGVENCLTVGEAHSDEEPDLRLLTLYASNDVVALFRRWWTARNRVFVALNQRPEHFPYWADGLFYEKSPYSYRRGWKYRSRGNTINLDERRLGPLTALAQEMGKGSPAEAYEPINDPFAPTWPLKKKTGSKGYDNDFGWEPGYHWSKETLEGAVIPENFEVAPSCGCVLCEGAVYQAKKKANQEKKEAEYAKLYAKVYGPYFDEPDPWGDDDDLF